MKKRLISLTVILTMLCAFVPAVQVSAHNGTKYGDYLYYKVNGNTAFITDCDEAATSVEIPPEIDGKSVTSIGDWAFERCDSLTSISIPNSVTSISDSAFNDCDSLTSINVDMGNKNYCSQNGILFNKNKTELICYPNGNTNNSYSIPNSVTSIGYSAFSYCDSLTSISIPNSVTSIGDDAFFDCDSLTSISIPNSVTSIGYWAFSDCDSLTSISIPNSVTSIGKYAFYNCSSLKDVYYSGTEAEWNAIHIEYDNSKLTNATIHYNSSGTGGGSSATAEPAKNVTVDNTYSGGNKMVEAAGIDADKLLNNITVSNDKLRGPKISVLGKTFYLFELDGKCSISLGNVKIQFKADEKKHTIQMLGGVDFINESMTTGTSYDTGRGIWTKQYNDLKSLYKGLAGGTLDDATARKKFGSVYNAMKNNNTNLFLNIKGNFALYGEIALDEGNIRFNEGGVIVKASASGSIDPRIGGIFYGTFGLSVDASGRIALKYDGKDKPLAINTKLTIEPALNVGVGAGSKKMKFYLEGGLKGKLPVDIAAVTGSFATGASVVPLKVTAKGYVYVSGKAGIFGTDKEWQLGGDVVLYPRSGDVELSSVSELFDGDAYSIDKSEFKMLPRNYNDEISLMSLSDTFQKTNLYPYSTPQLVRLADGRYLLLWVDDDASKADADRTSLYYSIFDKTVGYWTSPAIAVENAGYNDLPQIYVDGSNVHILWSAIDESLGDTTDMDTMTSKLDLYYTFFDGENFAAPELVSERNNGLCEMLYDISLDESGRVVAAWVENSANDMALSDGTNNIYKRVRNGGAWESVNTVAAVTDEVHDVGLAGGKVAYEIGTETGSDIYMDGVKIGTSENDNSAFKTTDNGIYYLSGTELKTYDIKTGKTSSAEMGEITDITILENGNDKIALTLLSTGFTNELYQNKYKNGKWGDWTQLTEYGKYIRDYSAAYADGSLTVALNLVDVKDEEKGGYGSAELRVLSDLEYSDIIVDDAPYYMGIAAGGSEIDVFCGVTNNSRHEITKADVNVTASGNTLYNGSVDCNIAPGATEWISVPVTLPKGFTKQDISISVASDFAENNTDNNTAVMTVGYTDLAVEDLAVKKVSGKLYLEGNISNIGLDAAENVTVKLYDRDSSGDVLKTITLNTINAGNKKAFSYELPTAYTTNTEGKTTIYAETATDSEEYDIGNNSDAIAMANLSEIDTISEVSMSYTDGMLTIKSPSAMGVDFYAAYYNADGSLMTCRKLELAIGAGTNNIAVEGLTTGSNVKFMLWGKDMAPLCTPLTWQ